LGFSLDGAITAHNTGGVHAEERRQLIVEETRRRSRVSASRLAAQYDVTAETVRRDLIELEDRGALRRIHGGALPLERVQVEPAVAERASRLAAEKQRIGIAALELVPEEGTVLLDAGTTTGAIAEHLPADRPLTVVTDDLRLALRLVPRSMTTVILLGGRVRGRTLATVDDFAVRMVNELRVDVAFIATNGLTERGCSTPDPAEAAVKRAMVDAADRVVLVADHTKFGQEHFVRFAELRDLDVVVTDDGADSTDVLMLEAAGLEVRVA
jgi:DeoR family transcriptional regulator, fructose operon transcriptional repressor